MSEQASEAPPYQHTQRAIWTLWFLVLSAAVTAIGLAYVAHCQLIFPISLLVVSMLIITALFMRTLTVTVDDERVTLRFGLGLFRKSLPLNTVRSCQSVRNNPLCGWGIKWFPGGWLYNVDGLSAVELEMVGGGRIRIGTDEPDRLLAAIQQRLPDGKTSHAG